MQILSNIQSSNTTESSKIKLLYTQKLSKEDVQDIKEELSKNANAMAFNSASMQSALFKKDKFAEDYNAFKTFLNDIGYTGKPIAELSKEEASELVSEDGFFGVKQTSQRIADFVINGAGGDEKLLRVGREGMLRGFKEAEEVWGGKLPDISQETMKRAIELVDKAMYDLGFSVLDSEA